MYQNSQRGSKIFTPIFPSAVSTQILSSQNNVAPALQLSQPVMAPQTFASQAVVPQVQSVAVPQVQSVAIPQVQSVVPQVQSVVPQVQSVVPQVQSIVPQVQSVVPTPIAQAPTLVPYIIGSDELKTKPTQNSVKDLRNLGIRPDFLVCRAPFPLNKAVKDKLSLFCSLPVEHVIDCIDVKSIYEVPMNLYKQNFDKEVLNHFKMKHKRINLVPWNSFINNMHHCKKEIEISLVGKYVSLHDAYLSVAESLRHAGYKYGVKVNINWVNSEDLEGKVNLSKVFKNTNGILVPGGFGNRGIEGKIKAIKYARENNIPFLGICLGMQLSVIEFARDVCNLKDADSTEFNSKTENPVIDIMEDKKNLVNIGGTLRLGNYDCHLIKDTLAYKSYKKIDIKERHRHRYEFNNKYKELLEKKGLVISGINRERDLVEIIEYPKNDCFIACQFHPEFKSRPTRPHPLFCTLIENSIKKK